MIFSKFHQLQKVPYLILLPNEVLAEICENLSPVDLYSLASTSKKLRNFLWSTSTITQQIWRNSRRLYFPQYKSQPLKDMSEQKYIYLAALAKKCQFCNEKDPRKLKNHKSLLKKHKISEDVLSTCLSFGEQGYFVPDVLTAQIEYSKTIDKFSWVTHKQLDVIQQKCRIISILLDEFHADSILGH
ncbi:18494_t:CDS:2, partial [Racocetra fulgida]